MTKITFSEDKKYGADGIMWVHTDEGLSAKAYWISYLTKDDERYRVYTVGDRTRGLVVFYLYRLYAKGEPPTIVEYGALSDLKRQT